MSTLEFSFLTSTINNARTKETKSTLYQTSSSYSNNNDNNKKKKKRNKHQNQGRVGYNQVGGPILHASLTESNVDQLLQKRTKARRAQNFSKADEILQMLLDCNIFVNDKLKVWRGDGYIIDVDDISSNKNGRKDDDNNNPGHTSTRTGEGVGSIYTKSSKSQPISAEDETYVLKKLSQRSMAKHRRKYDVADDIRDELRYLFQIEVNDAAQTFCVMKEPYRDIQSTFYTFGGKRTVNMGEDSLQKIEQLVKERAEAKKKKDYALADELLDMLDVDYNVRVDDQKKKWHFKGQKRESQDKQHMEEVRDIIRQWEKKGDEWSLAPKVGGSNSSTNSPAMPEGIVIEDNSSKTVHSNIPAMPEGIVLEDDSSKTVHSNIPAMPEGIVLEDDNPISNNSGPTMPEGIVLENDEWGSHDNDKITSIPEGITIMEETPHGVGDGHNDDKGNRNISRSDLESLTVVVIKDKLREAGLPVSGRKAELIDRLLSSS